MEKGPTWNDIGEVSSYSYIQWNRTVESLSIWATPVSKRYKENYAIYLMAARNLHFTFYITNQLSTQHKISVHCFWIKSYPTRGTHQFFHSKISNISFGVQFWLPNSVQHTRYYFNFIPAETLNINDPRPPGHDQVRQTFEELRKITEIAEPGRLRIRSITHYFILICCRNM